MNRTRRPSPQTTAVLRALRATTGWSHGYDLCRELDLKAGTVYPILIRLAERGLVETVWEDDAPQGRPARHLYRLSSAGVDLLESIAAVEPTAARATPSPALRPSLGGAGT